MKLRDDSALRYSTREGTRVSGPYTLEGLESLVYLGRITPATMIAREGHGEFIPIQSTELMGTLFPNWVANTAPENWAPPGQSKSPARPGRKRYQLGEARFEKVNDNAARGPRIEVTNLLDEIRQTEIESGYDLPKRHRFRISKRSRDFWIMLVVGNVLFLGGGILLQNTASIVFGIAGSGLYTWGLLWSMYGVMDRY